MPEIYSPSASSKSYGGTGSPTTDRFSFANRPDYRTLGKGEVEEEFYQRFPSFRATRSFANTTLDGHFQELASILATRSVEEREAIWRSIEQEFLSVNSPEKVLVLLPIFFNNAIRLERLCARAQHTKAIGRRHFLRVPIERIVA